MPKLKPKMKSVPLAIPEMDRLKVFRLIAKARALEERLIKMAKSTDSFFWIGGPGEEAFNIPLGLLVKKGQGPQFDFLHLHYRSSGILLAMGMDLRDAIRQGAAVSTDPYSGGRNFPNHYAYKPWNVMPITSTIGTQFAVAPGNALANKRHGKDSITIVTGGDAGTAQGDFATCLNWASRPKEELPLLIIVMNNWWGISTPHEQVQGASVIAKRAEPFGIEWNSVDGNDPEESWKAIYEAMHYVRTQRRPFCLEAHVSRLHGHSSSSGAKRVENEPDPLQLFEQQLVQDDDLTQEEVKAVHQEFENEALSILKEVRKEPKPSPDSIYDHIFAKEQD